MKKHLIASVAAAAAAAVLALPPGAAHAADNDVLTASATGAHVSLTVDWTGDDSFTLRDIELRDTECDDDPVYFYVEVPGFRYPDHKNESGCGTVASWGSLPGSLSSSIGSLSVTVCRNERLSPDTCGTSGKSYNPYY